MMNKEDGHSTGRNAGMRTAVWTGAGGQGCKEREGGGKGERDSGIDGRVLNENARMGGGREG